MLTSFELTEIVIDNGNRKRLLSSVVVNKAYDPKGDFLQRWNKIILISCVLALACDPLFFYIPVIDGKNNCLKLDDNLKIISTTFRSFMDIFYLLRIILQFRTGFFAPHRRFELGGNQLITNHAAIARRYLSSYFIVDILAVLPLPQMTVYAIIPSLVGGSLISEGLLKLVIFAQFVPRLIRIYPLYKEIHRTSGMITETMWAGAAFNMFIYMLASHVVGAVWYFFAIDQQGKCWQKSCTGQGCYNLFLYCNDKSGVNYSFNSSYCNLVDPDQIIGSTVFNFGLFYDALRLEVVQSTNIVTKFFYCFWWGLRSLRREEQT